MSYLNSLQRHAAMDDVRSVVARKAGVGDHTAERFADHELNANHGFAFGPGAIDWKTVERLNVEAAEWPAKSDEMAAQAGLGTVIWFDVTAGYGFVEPDDGGPEMFARLPSNKNAIKTLVAGDRYELAAVGKRAKTEAFIRAKAS